MPVVRAAKTRRADGPGTKRAGLATPSLGATELVVCSVEAELGRHGSPQKHDREEVVLVVGGSGRVTLDDESHEVAARDTVIEYITCEPAGIRIFDPDENEKEVPWTMR